MKPAKNLSLLAMLVAVLAACTSTPIEAPKAPSPPPAAPVAAPAAAPAPAPAAVAPRALPASTVATATLPAHLDPKSVIASRRSVLFDFDSFAIRGEDTPLIEQHGKYLATHPVVAIKIEGHADERGGTEYNLALGQKRAEVVLRALRVYGVKDSQMEAISWGESRPRAAGHDEAAWAQNRRADLQYPAK